MKTSVTLAALIRARIKALEESKNPMGAMGMWELKQILFDYEKMNKKRKPK